MTKAALSKTIAVVMLNKAALSLEK